MSYWIRVGPHPVTGILMRCENRLRRQLTGRVCDSEDSDWSAVSRGGQGHRTLRHRRGIESPRLAS